MTGDEAVAASQEPGDTDGDLLATRAAVTPWRWALCGPLIALAAWRLLDSLQLSFGPLWSYYLAPPNPVLWVLVLSAAAGGLSPRVPWGAVKAGFFVFVTFFLWIMPPEAGSDAAHPDHFLAYEVDRVSSQIWEARKTRSLPSHPLDLRTQLMAPIELSYRHRDTGKERVSLRIDIETDARGPTSQVADRPGVIHVAIERGGEERIWLRATGLDGQRFGEPSFLREPDATTPATILVRHPRGGVSRQAPQAPKPRPKPVALDAGQTRPLDGGPG